MHRPECLLHRPRGQGQSPAPSCSRASWLHLSLQAVASTLHACAVDLPAYADRKAASREAAERGCARRAVRVPDRLCPGAGAACLSCSALSTACTLWPACLRCVWYAMAAMLGVEQHGAGSRIGLSDGPLCAQLQAHMQQAAAVGKPMVVDEFNRKRPVSVRNAFLSQAYAMMTADGSPVVGAPRAVPRRVVQCCACIVGQEICVCCGGPAQLRAASEHCAPLQAQMYGCRPRPPSQTTMASRSTGTRRGRRRRCRPSRR